MRKRYTFFSKNWLRFGLVVSFAVSGLNSYAQIAPAKMWDRTFGGNNDDLLCTMQQTTDGGYILGGYSQSGNTGDKSQPSNGGDDYWIVKLDATGNKLWDKTFGGNDTDQLSTLQQTADGGYIVGGTSRSDISGDKSQASKGGDDFWIVKLDANGTKIWDKTIGGRYIDQLSSIQQTSDGGYILGGTSGSDISGDKSQNQKGGFDYWLVKLDASGNKLWDKTIGGYYEDYLTTLQPVSGGGYLLGGHSRSINGLDKSQNCRGEEDYWVVKVDANGNILWDKTFGGNYRDFLYALKQTPDGGYILGGHSYSGLSGDKTQAAKGGSDYWIVKLDSTGNKLWDKTFGSNDHDFFTTLNLAADGGYVLGGWSGANIGGDKSQFSKGSADYWLIKVDASGSKLWNTTIGGNSDDVLYTLQQTFDGGYILSGHSKSGISFDKSQACQGDFDFWVVKLRAEITGVNEYFSNSQMSVSPNPSQGKFYLQLENISTPKVKVIITDLLGCAILQKELPVANKQLSEELEIKAAKGMYLLQIKAGNQTTSRKIVVE